MHTSFSTIAEQDEDIEYIVEEIALAGYKGIEIWGPHVERHIKKRGSLSSLKKLIDHHELGVSALSTECNFTGTHAESADSLSLGKRFIDYSDVLERPVVRMLTGGVGAAEADDGAWDRCIEALQNLCDYAQPKGICVAIKNHQNSLCDTAESTIKLIDRVNYPNFRISYDVWHSFSEEKKDPVKVLDVFFPYIAHVQVKNAKGKNGGPLPTRVRYLAEGTLNYKPVLKKLKELDYKGFVAVEWLGIDRAAVWDVAAHEYKYLKQFCE